MAARLNAPFASLASAALAASITVGMAPPALALASVSTTAPVVSAVPATVTSTPGWTTKNVNLRTGPSTSYTSLATIPAGTPITIHSTRSGVWNRVTTPRGDGWMSSNLFTTTPPSTLRPAAPSTTPVANVTGARFSAAGMTSTYHVRAQGIDYSKPVGALFYFDGDYYGRAASITENPTSRDFTALAAEANRRNLVFIAPVTPSSATSANGYTWWERVNQNGDWQRAFARDILGGNPSISPDRIHLMGYSGGAEFISGELSKDRPETWMRTGSAIMVAGGGHFNGPIPSTTPSATFRQSVDLRWYAGSLDVAGQTNPPTWSALSAAQKGSAAYRAAGFSRARLVTLQGLGHHDYVLHSIMAQHFNAIGVQRLR